MIECHHPNFAVGARFCDSCYAKWLMHKLNNPNGGDDET